MRGVKVKARSAGFLTRAAGPRGCWAVSGDLGLLWLGGEALLALGAAKLPAVHRKPPQQKVTWQEAEAEGPHLSLSCCVDEEPEPEQLSNVSWGTQPESPSLMSSCAPHY